MRALKRGCSTPQEVIVPRPFLDQVLIASHSSSAGADRADPARSRRCRRTHDARNNSVALHPTRAEELVDDGLRSRCAPNTFSTVKLKSSSGTSDSRVAQHQAHRAQVHLATRPGRARHSVGIAQQAQRHRDGWADARSAPEQLVEQQAPEGSSMRRTLDRPAAAGLRQVQWRSAWSAAGRSARDRRAGAAGRP